MSLYAILKEKRVERKKVADAAGAILTKAHTEKRQITADETKEFEARHADVDKLEGEITQYERQYELEQKLGQPAPDSRQAGREDIEAPGAPDTKEHREQVAAWEAMQFRAWCSGGVGGMSPEMRAAYAASQAELQKDPSWDVRALSDVTGTAGFYTVPQGFVYKLEVALKYFGGIVDAADYIPTEMGNLLPWPSVNDTTNTGETIAENTAVAGTTGGAAAQDPAYGVVNFSAYMHDSGFVLVPLQLLQDSAFSVDDYLVELLKIRLGRRKNSLCTTGTGTSQPTGVVTAASLGKAGASPTTMSYNEILDLEHSVDPAYRNYSNPKVGFMFNDSTLKAIKKLTDNNGRPLWLAGGVSEGIQQRRPDQLDGWPFWVNQDMASLAASAKSVLFGDFSKYKIRQVRQIQMVRASERFIDKLQIGFLAWQRFDGNIVDAGTHPITYFQNSAT